MSNDKKNADQNAPMTPLQFHDRLGELIREGGRAKITLPTIVGVMFCTTIDVVVQAISEGKQQVAADIAESLFQQIQKKQKGPIEPGSN